MFLFLAREVAERLATTTMYSSPPPMKPSNRAFVRLGKKLTTRANVPRDPRHHFSVPAANKNQSRGTA